MAVITTRQTAGVGATVAGAPLTNAQVDTNFINLNAEVYVDNFPTIKPSLMLDFANSGVADPRITFTRASTSTYFNSFGVLQSAAINAPRFDYDPSTLVARGLLIEEQRTNQCTYSADFTNAAWVTSIATKTTGVSDPFGGNTAATVTATSAAGSMQNASATVLVSTVYTVSCWMRRRTGTGPVGIRAVENANTTVTITSTWARYSVTVTATQTIGRAGVFVQTIGDEIDVWGFQLEAGAFVTSYIPTTTTALTRSADVASVNTLSPWYNQTEGSWVAEASFLGSNANALAVWNNPILKVAEAADNSVFGENLLFGTTPVPKRVQYASRDSVTNASVFFSPEVVPDTPYKIAGARADGSTVSIGYAGQVSTSTLTSTPPTRTRLFIGRGVTGSVANAPAPDSMYLNGHIRRITYYPRRLSNAELQAITS